MTANDPNARADRLLDANLRQFGARADTNLPHHLSPEQLAAFKSAPALRPSPRPARSRILFGLSSAAAAVIIAVGVVLFPGVQPQQVSAATILDSLRARTITGVRMVIYNANQDGVRLDGEFILHFRTPRTMNQLIDEADLPDPAEDVDVLLNATVTADQGDLAGFSLDFHAAFSPQARWVFARSTDRPFPANAGPDAMPLRFAHNLLRQGVFVDLTTFDFDSLRQQLDHLDPDPDFDFDFDDDTNANTNARPRSPGTLSLGLALNDAQNPLAQFFSQLLTGRAGPAQFDQFRQMVESAGGSATVEPMGNDRFLLTAIPDAADAPCFSALLITYARDTGVEQVELIGPNTNPANTPNTDGSIILTFLADPIDPARLSPDTLLSPNTFTLTQDMINTFLPFIAPTPRPRPATPTPTN